MLTKKASDDLDYFNSGYIWSLSTSTSETNPRTWHPKITHT